MINDIQDGDSQSTGFYVLMIMLFLVFFAIISSFLEHKKWPIHRGAVSITVGIILGLIFYISSSSNYSFIVKFDENIIFSVLFPIMVYVEGYSFDKNSFIKNIRHIVLFGLFGTLLSFTVVTILLIEANQLNLIRGNQDTSKIRTLVWWQILILSACLCSTDTDASCQAIPQRKFPRLNSIISGQSTFKDVMTIVLLNSFLQQQNQQSSSSFDFSLITALLIIGQFAYVIIVSALFGLISGCLVSFMFKKFRFLKNNNGITETCLIFLTGLITYLTSDLIEASGLVSILAFGVILKEVNSYNLSQQSQKSSQSTLLILNVICEGLLYLIMGVLVWQVSWYDPTQSDQVSHSFIFVLVVMVILFVGRIFNVYVVWWIVTRFFTKFDLKKQELRVIFLSGLVRGSTAFALFCSVKLSDNKQYAKNEGLILKTTIIIIVMFCSIVINSIIPKIYKKPLQSLKEQLKGQLLYHQKQPKDQQKIGKVRAFFRKIKENKLMPFLVYNYQTVKAKKHQTQQQLQMQSDQQQDQNTLNS